MKIMASAPTIRLILLGWIRGMITRRICRIVSISCDDGINVVFSDHPTF